MYIFYDNDNENENEKQLTETAETNVEKVDAERKPTQVSAKQADECKVSSVQPIHGRATNPWKLTRRIPALPLPSVSTR